MQRETVKVWGKKWTQTTYHKEYASWPVISGSRSGYQATWRTAWAKWYHVSVCYPQPPVWYLCNREHEVKERDRSRKKGAGVLVNSYSDMGITHEAAVNILSHRTVEKKSCLQPYRWMLLLWQLSFLWRHNLEHLFLNCTYSFCILQIYKLS